MSTAHGHFSRADGILKKTWKEARDLKRGLRAIPGVGPGIEQDLIRLGYPTVESLRDADPEEIYARDCASRGPVDRCMLYVYRCAVYYASHELHNPALLRWWNWKDGCQKEDSDE